MDQQTQQEGVRRFVCVASTVSGLVCYALSSCFNNLLGKWNWLKISAYSVLSFIICLAFMFPKAWQHWRIFRYRAHFTFLVLTLTTVYSFYLDTKLKTTPDVYGIVSSAAFATASLCMSNQIECGFLDLLYFFCGVLILQLMEIKLLFGTAGIGFTYFLIIIRSCLDAPPRSEPRSQSQSQSQSHHHPDQVAIDMAALLESPSSSRSSHSSSTQNQQATITPILSVPAALPSSASLLQSKSSRAPRRFRSSRGAPVQSRTRTNHARALDITQKEGSRSTQNQAIITPVYSVAALSSASLRRRSSRASQRFRDSPARYIGIQNQAEEEEIVDIVASMPSPFHYATSGWCLNELQKIVEYYEGLGIVPIFYDVDPSHVRYQKGRFRHESEKVKKWRDALSEVAGCSGWESEDM